MTSRARSSGSWKSCKGPCTNTTWTLWAVTRCTGRAPRLGATWAKRSLPARVTEARDEGRVRARVAVFCEPLECNVLWTDRKLYGAASRNQLSLRAPAAYLRRTWRKPGVCGGSCSSTPAAGATRAQRWPRTAGRPDGAQPPVRQRPAQRRAGTIAKPPTGRSRHCTTEPGGPERATPSPQAPSHSLLPAGETPEESQYGTVSQQVKTAHATNRRSGRHAMPMPMRSRSVRCESRRLLRPVCAVLCDAQCYTGLGGGHGCVSTSVVSMPAAAVPRLHSYKMPSLGCSSNRPATSGRLGEGPARMGLAEAPAR
eukprot:COSAG04_NODE_523_length_13126_cov_19.987570_2_plen_312_part_00